ncbi:MAG: tetratricopeptide repeat protein [bacterium]|nr:tetratricopeptide repeat protein [bacterium]
MKRLSPGPCAAALVILAGLAAAGCAPQLDRIEIAVQENHDEIARMQAENKRLLQEVQSLAALMRLEQDMGDESSAMSYAKLSQVSTRLDQLLQKLDDNAEYMRDLSARVDLLAARSGVPTLGEYRPPAADAAADLPEEGRAILTQAELDRNRGNLELAKEGFEEFLQRFGDAEAADQALYWLGDLAGQEDRHDMAMGYFERLLAERPGSALVPSALFKARRSLLALNRTDEAWAMGGRLLREYPESHEAALLGAERE